MVAPLSDLNPARGRCTRDRTRCSPGPAVSCRPAGYLAVSPSGAGVLTLISNGIPPSRMSALRNALTAVDMDRPSSSRMAVASFLTSGSMRIVVAGMLDGMASPLLVYVSANLKSTTFANVSRRMRQRAFANPANVLSPTAQTELCSDRVSDPGGAGYGAKRNGRAERLQGVRRQAELQRDREEARHGPAHGRQVLEGGRGRRRREVREGQCFRPARGGDPREGPAARDDQDGRLRVPARGPRGGAARVRRLHRVVPGARRALWGRGRPRAAPAVRDAPGQAVHDAASGPSRPINYDPDHHEQALEGKRGLADADIAEAARANLALLDSLGGA